MTILRVSDHALVRFFQRAHGVAVEDIRGRLAEDLSKSADAPQLAGAPVFGIKAHGLVFLVRDGTVVTVVEAQRPFSLMFADGAR